MPQDVTFDLPFETPVSEHPEFARARHLRRILDMDLVRGKAGFEEYRSWDLPQATARTRPHAPAADLAVLMNRFSPAFRFRDRFDAGVGSVGLPGAAAHRGSDGRATPDGPRVLPDRHG
ncbi:hypothetical protein ABTY98_03485 [Streptomyces sp. NPDC096040]|uniref:hypothetical protein n=1 Tax=Streptomyces sp. NPDC096040 TaxID=3155541 RepID=UPI003321C4A7